MLLASAMLSAPRVERMERASVRGFGFVANCAMDTGFDAIAYPSVASATGYNLVVFANDEPWKDRVPEPTQIVKQRALRRTDRPAVRQPDRSAAAGFLRRNQQPSHRDVVEV